MNQNNKNELILKDEKGCTITKEICQPATFLLTVIIEVISQTKLWSINFSMESMMVGIEIILNTEYIKEYINISAALSMYINQCFYEKIEYKPKA